MTKADELWGKYKFQDVYGSYVPVTQFLAALKEYGELVKAEAVKVCREQMNQADSRHNHGVAVCAAAIEKMKLP